MSFRCFKLNADYLPQELCSWFDAINLILDNKVDVLWHYPEEVFKIRSQYQEWPCPSIIVLKNNVKRRPQKKTIYPSLQSILIRDSFQCQYCSKKLTLKTGSRDHIIPQSKPLSTNTYANLVACCKPCQAKKGNKYLHEVADMKLIRPPKVPKLEETLISQIRVANRQEKETWKAGLSAIGMNWVFEENN